MGFPSVGTRGHGIVQHRRRRLVSSALEAVSLSRIFYVVSLSWLLYASVFVDRRRLPTFLDPPWLLLSSHPARFDQPVIPPRTIAGLHHLHGKTSAFKNCPFGGSLPSILPALSPWQSSALYYDCSVPSAPLGLVHLGSVVPAVSSYCWSHGNYGGLLFLGGLHMSESVFNWRPGLLGKTFMVGESDFNLGKEMSSLFIGIGFRFSWRVWGVLPRGSFPRTIFGSLC